MKRGELGGGSLLNITRLLGLLSKTQAVCPLASLILSEVSPLFDSAGFPGNIFFFTFSE